MPQPLRVVRRRLRGTGGVGSGIGEGGREMGFAAKYSSTLPMSAMIVKPHRVIGTSWTVNRTDHRDHECDEQKGGPFVST